MNRRAVFLGTLALQSGLLALIVGQNENILKAGKKVCLEIRAVDPMDLFSGRYISTPLAISNLNLDSIPHFEPSFFQNQAVFVTLTHGPEYWTPIQVSSQPPDLHSNPPHLAFLKGRVAGQSGKQLRVDFGIDRFYIPSEAEDPSAWRGQNQRPKLALIVRVDAGGTGVVEDLLVDGKPFQEWNRAQKK